MQKPPFATLPALLFAVGLGMAFYFGEAWWRLPVYSAADVAASADLNLALEYRQPRPASEMTAEALAARRTAIEAELAAQIAEERSHVQSYCLIGLVMAAVGLAQMVLLRRMAGR